MFINSYLGNNNNILIITAGARMLYKNLPRNVGLRRLTLHKSATGPNVNYILLVECSHFLDNINQVRLFSEGRFNKNK